MNALLLAIALFAQVQTHDSRYIEPVPVWVADQWTVTERGKDGDWLIAIASKDYPETIVLRGARKVVSLGVKEGETRYITLGTGAQSAYRAGRGWRQYAITSPTNAVTERTTVYSRGWARRGR